MPVEKRIFSGREEWLAARKNHIGGSDASACVGMNPYKSNVELWKEKMGIRIPEDISDKPYVQYGTKAER
ncbi:MAG: YqaJ viral recombinase family protein [Clostridium sp.]